jgi:hypothetical protein
MCSRSSSVSQSARLQRLIAVRGEGATLRLHFQAEISARVAQVVAAPQLKRRQSASDAALALCRRTTLPRSHRVDGVGSSLRHNDVVERGESSLQGISHEHHLAVALPQQRRQRVVSARRCVSAHVRGVCDV